MRVGVGNMAVVRPSGAPFALHDIREKGVAVHPTVRARNPLRSTADLPVRSEG